MTRKLRYTAAQLGILMGLCSWEPGMTGVGVHSYAAEPPLVSAVSAVAFLDSIGVNTHVAQGYDAASYVEPLGYTGIRQVRDGAGNVSADIKIHQQTGVRFVINAGGDLPGLLQSARALAEADALLALEGPNEANNFAITYDGNRGGGAGGTWVPVAQFQKALYAAAKDDALLRRYPIFGPSEVGAETDNVGLQFLTVPAGLEDVFPAGTRFADYANVHNYVSGNGNVYQDNQAWNAADPTLNERWDGLHGNNGKTWHKHYPGYTDAQLITLPRVTTETGWDTTGNPGGEHTQGTILTNTYLAQFKRGWDYTFVYELRDGEGGEGDQGLYHGAAPKLAAIYLHNMTTVLHDDSPVAKAKSLTYAIPDEPATVHDLLLQKSNGRFELIVWDERVRDSDAVKVDLGVAHKTVKIYDVTIGTAPVQTLANVSSVELKLSDHAMIIEVGG